MDVDADLDPQRASVGKCIAVLWDGLATSAPIVNPRIPGVGIVEWLSPQVVDDAVRTIRNPLPLPLEFVR